MFDVDLTPTSVSYRVDMTILAEINVFVYHNIYQTIRAVKIWSSL